jgi:hypothetical protein
MSNEFRTAQLAINAYKALVAQSAAYGSAGTRTNADRTRISVQQAEVKNAINAVKNAAEIAELRKYWNA